MRTGELNGSSELRTKDPGSSLTTNRSYNPSGIHRSFGSRKVSGVEGCDDAAIRRVTVSTVSACMTTTHLFNLGYRQLDFPRGIGDEVVFHTLAGRNSAPALGREPVRVQGSTLMDSVPMDLSGGTS